MSELLDGEVGKEVVYGIKIENKMLKIEVKYDGKGANAGVFLELEAGYFLDKLAEAIPGSIDDAIIGAIKAAL